MSPRHAARWERLVTALMLAIVLAVLLAFVALLRPAPPWTPPQVNLQAPVVVDVKSAPGLSLDELAVIWQRDLRQPLVDPSPPEPPKPPPPPRLAVRLLGTAVEADRRYGLLRLSNNTTVVRPVGAEVEGFEVVSIRRGWARLRNGAREYDLIVPWYDRIAVQEPSNGR